eukprot:TRINITY_DN24921_c0_g1_i1.p1 TRINITY_DN24921_c0_g1~~TRINITY_DN24921_c0_g1_i1.p1  ORF type:complete len:658 (-),score=137.35 TRINITY_DN24921_c0_g1_i1:311-2284(-)
MCIRDSIICNLGSLSVTPRTSRGTTEGPQATTTADEEDMDGSGAFQLDPIPLAVKTIQLSEDAATDIEKAVARASDWSNSTANMLSMSSSAKPGGVGGMASPRTHNNTFHSRTHSEGESSSYGSCLGDTVGETANPFKMKLNLGQTAQPMTFKLNLPVTDANNDEGYIALPPPTARQENDSLGGTYNDMGDHEDVDVQKMKSKMREYEDQIESLIEQVETLRGSRGSTADINSPYQNNATSTFGGAGGGGSTSSNNTAALPGATGGGFVSATPRFPGGVGAAGSPRDVRPRSARVGCTQSGGVGGAAADSPVSEDTTGPADPLAIAQLKKQFKEQRLNYDRQVGDLKLKLEEKEAIINAWKVVTDSAKSGIVGSDGMKTARMNIHTARGNIQTARQQYRMTARNRSARETADAEAQLEAAEGMLDLQESVRNFITNTHDTVEVIEGPNTPRGGDEPLRTARLRMGSSSPIGLPTVPHVPAVGSAPAPSGFRVTNTAKPPGVQAVIPPATRPISPSTTPGENSLFVPPRSLSPSAISTPQQHIDPTATEIPAAVTVTPLQGRSRKGGAKAKPKMAGSDLHSQFQNCCNLLRETAMTAEMSAAEERQRNAESGSRIRAMVEELEAMKKLRDQEQAILKVQLDRLASGKPKCEEVGIQTQ